MHSPLSSPPRAALPSNLLPGFKPSDAAAAEVALQFQIHADKSSETRNVEHVASALLSPLPSSSHAVSSPPNGPALSPSPALVPVPVGIAKSSPPESTCRALQPLAVIHLPLNGSEILVGRSSKKCAVALPARNRLISRVHARVWYHDRLIAIECLGHNGLTVQVPRATKSGSRRYTGYDVVSRQCIYVEHCEGVELHVHGDRVRIEFDHGDNEDTTEDEDMLACSPAVGKAAEKTAEPGPVHMPLESIISEPKAVLEVPEVKAMADLPTTPSHFESDVQQEQQSEQQAVSTIQDTGAKTEVPTPVETLAQTVSSQDTGTSSVQEPKAQQPTVNAADVASTHATTGDLQQTEDRQTVVTKRSAPEIATPDELERLVINAIAFSRLTSIPLSQICTSSRTLEAYNSDEIRNTLKNVACIGVINRTGKDAVGRPLEPEYYYLSENDFDSERRELIEQSKGGRKSLRSCRKTHKQYFYRKPR